MSRRVKEDACGHLHIMERLIEEAKRTSRSLREKTELEKLKMLGVIVNIRTNTMLAVPCVPFILQTRTCCAWHWNASHVVIPLRDDTDFASCAQACNSVGRIATWQSCSRRHQHRLWRPDVLWD